MEMISIIIPMYNEEEAIGGDLDAIIQTMSGSDVPWEIIVVDDGSADVSAEIVRQREGVRLIQHSYNRGTGAARTTGLQHARGDVNCDDRRRWDLPQPGHPPPPGPHRRM
jgi:glycosyltransferase involved in cell wall biosynthesis